MNIFQNIRIRLTLWYLLVVATLMLFFGGVAYVLLSDSLSRKTIDPWQMKWALVQSGDNGFDYVITGLSDVAPTIGMSSQRANAVIGFTRSELLGMADEDGMIRFHTSGGLPIAIHKDLLTSAARSEVDMVWFYLVGDYRVLVVIQSAYSVTQTLYVYRQGILVAALVALVLAGILGFFLVSRMLQPVQAITRTAKEIEEHNLSRRLEVRTKDEIGDLASTLNQTFSRLESAFVREREFTADASHELRTPLAIAQGEATLALREERTKGEYREALETVSRQISKASSLINRLLFLARTDDRLELTKTDVDLRALLIEAASDAQVLCEPKGISLRSDLSENSDGSDSVTVRADAVRLRELFLNLLDNAVRYTPAGGTITISLKQDGDYARAAVQDTGVGIPPEHLTNIFRRFYRVDKSRSRAEGGVGLGLAISQRIAEVHGGRIDVASEPGKGSTFSVFLPLAK